MTLSLGEVVKHHYMEDILIVHRKSQTNFDNSSHPHLAIFKTCLRKILFTTEADLVDLTHVLHEEDQILRDEEALSLLLEILCGLHSPIIGETEILGQFNIFVESRRSSADPLFSETQKWLQFITAEVKRVRTHHLIGLGSQSYGSLLRKHCRDAKKITILGSGPLTQEILPWFNQKEEIQVISRNPKKISTLADKIPHVEIASYETCNHLNESLVIAAPLSDESILALLQLRTCSTKSIYDLRGEHNQLKDKLKARYPHIKLMDLNQFFADIEETKKQHQNIVLTIKQYILEKAVNFCLRTELRPLGWDDLCA